MRETKLSDSHTWALRAPWRTPPLQVFGSMAQTLSIERLPPLPLETWLGLLGLLATSPSLASMEWWMWLAGI